MAGLPLVALACGLATPTPTTASTNSRYEAVARGAVYEARSWLSADLTSRLRADGASLLADGAFRSSGLSNTARGEQGDQGFGENDRSVLAITPELGGDVSARAELQLLIDQLRLELSTELQRPGLVCAEQYYSVSGAGASLPLHMDERHEEAKGARGWAGTYRRSLSWLVYLSAPQHAQKCSLGTARARLLCLLRARLADMGGSELPGRGGLSGRPATASSVRASRLQSCPFPRL